MARLSAASLFVGLSHLAYTSAVMAIDECPSWRLAAIEDRVDRFVAGLLDTATGGDRD